MSDDISGWTVTTLHRHLSEMMSEKDRRDEQRFAAQQVALRDALSAQEKAVGAALQAAERAVNKAEIAAEKRFDNVNEFRAQLADQAANLMPRSESTVLLDALDSRLKNVEARMNQQRGQASGLDRAQTLTFAAVGVLVALLGITVAVIVALTR